jgi:hypothetical protein
MIDSILHDVRYALRLIRLKPGFAAVAILSLAAGAVAPGLTPNSTTLSHGAHRHQAIAQNCSAG